MRDKDFTRLYGQHAPQLYRFLRYRVGDPVAAEDLMADTFVRVLQSRSGYDSRRGSETTWLFAIALNCVRDHVRRTGAETRALERVAAGRNEESLDLAWGEDLDERGALRQALMALSEAEREVSALRFGADLELKHIAEVIGAPRSTVEFRLYGGLRQVRDLLGEAF
jgi:RNA polymerase sigma-70 factor (ECF subfamily)